MLFSKSRQKKIRGFLYVTAQDNLELFETPIGSKFIKANRTPPWLVVNHTLDEIIVTKWSGRLLKVEILDQANEKDLNKGLVHDIWYTRTLGVELLEELSTEELFNPEGKVITQILDFANSMDEDQVAYFCQFEITRASEIYSHTWNKWLKNKDPHSIHLNQDHSRTLGIFPNNSRKTMHRSFSVVSDIVWNRAKEVLGEKAYTIDKEGEYILDKSWSHATAILRHATMAFHGQEHLTQNEKEVLLKPWRSVTNIT